jgi:hypothetical protein
MGSREYNQTMGYDAWTRVVEGEGAGIQYSAQHIGILEIKMVHGEVAGLGRENKRVARATTSHGLRGGASP